MCAHNRQQDVPRPLPGEVTDGAVILSGAEPDPASRTGRRKLWDLEKQYLCPVIGTCLGLDDLARIARKAGYADTSADEFELHVRTVSVAGSRNAASRALHKLLDRKHARYVRDFERARDDGAVECLWREHFDGGLVAGPLWAVMSHRAASPETRSRAYRDVHMLSHQVGAGLAADARRLAYLERELDRIQLHARQEVERLGQEIGSRGVRIRELEAKLAERQRDAQELSALRRRLAELDSGQVVVGMGRRIQELESSNGRLFEEVQRFSAIAAELPEAFATAARLREERDTLAAERDALERLLTAEATEVPPCDGHCDSCPDCLRGRCVLCVGGRIALIPHYRQLAERLGVRLVYHDGGREEALSRLPDLLAASDAVICPTDCVSHQAYYHLKRHCKRTGKPCVLAKSCGLAGFAAALERLAAGHVDLHTQPVTSM